jgi:hypothetical protein
MTEIYTGIEFKFIFQSKFNCGDNFDHNKDDNLHVIVQTGALRVGNVNLIQLRVQ